MCSKIKKVLEKHVLLNNTLAFESLTAQGVRLEDQIITKQAYETTNTSVCEEYLVVVRATF